MSDTPRTDAQKFGASCAEDFCRVLERENAALRKDKERLMDMLRDREHSVSVWMQHAKQSDQKLAAAQQAHQCDLDRRANVVKSLRKVEAENAALRELSARMATEMREVDHEFASLRDYDAARKEAKP